MLNQQIKKTIIDALMKVVDSAPTRSNSRYNSYTPGYLYSTSYKTGYIEPYTISDESFKVWTNYVFSVLQIAAQQVDPSISYPVYKQIQSIVYLNGSDNASKTLDICRIILDYARNILNT